MCCFSGPVAEVANTNMFARGGDDGRQFLVYQMELRADAALAMILPLPVIPNAREDAVSFLDFRSYPGFFLDLQKPFVAQPRTRTGGGAAPQALPILKVHRVGSFEASFVPSLDDFERLDPRFRLPHTVWDARYQDWGFAVFKLHDLAQPTTIEPMALSFPRRDPSTLFFPAVHIHDGRLHPTAHYDHNLFFQHASEDAIASVGNHARRAASSNMPAREMASPLHARGVLDENLPIQIARFAGELPNHDARVAPEARSLDLRGPLPADRAVALITRLAEARLAGAADDLAAAHALVGRFAGTMQAPSYGEGFAHMPPELVKQEAAPDERSDVYAFGSLLYELLSGEPPFGTYSEALVGHLTKEVRLLGSPLDGLIARAMQKDPAQRFPSLRALVEALRA